eukprot:Clim_evm8s151 gene=Clim_evmTU8s151
MDTLSLLLQTLGLSESEQQFQTYEDETPEYGICADPFDPRSPTPGLLRTPIAAMLQGQKMEIQQHTVFDPRSPSINVLRSPHLHNEIVAVRAGSVSAFTQCATPPPVKRKSTAVVDIEEEEQIEESSVNDPTDDIGVQTPTKGRLPASTVSVSACQTPQHGMGQATDVIPFSPKEKINVDEILEAIDAAEEENALLEALSEFSDDSDFDVEYEGTPGKKTITRKTTTEVSEEHELSPIVKKTHTTNTYGTCSSRTSTPTKASSTPTARAIMPGVHDKENTSGTDSPLFAAALQTKTGSPALRSTRRRLVLGTNKTMQH